MNKKSLLLGCGSKWGAEFTRVLADNNYIIDLVGKTGVEHDNVSNILIDWHTITLDNLKEIIPIKQYDLIFFNQNSGGSVNDHWLKNGNIIPLDSWNKNYWIDTQIPYYIIHHLSSTFNEQTKIGWMLTGLIQGSDKNYFQYAGYACSKASNLHIMRGFSQFMQGIFFAINPWWFPLDQYNKDAKDILKIIESLSSIDSGNSFNKDGSKWV